MKAFPKVTNIFCQILFCLIFFPLIGYSQISILQIIEKADEQRGIYQETFKNLFAKEIKTSQSFNKNGNLTEQRKIESNFLVYQSQKDESAVSEYRSIFKVNNVANTDSDKNAEIFFNNLLKLNSADEELRRIQFENTKFDQDLAVSGLTLLQAPVLAAHLRPYFDFKILGKENGQYIIAFQQIKPSPFVLINNNYSSETKLTMDFGINLPNSIGQPNPAVRGKLWIDEKTFQLWREERELTIQPNKVTNPLVVFKVNFEFEKTKLKILVPKRINLISYLIMKKRKGIISQKNAQIDFEYTDFGCADVTVKSSGILEPVVIEKKEKN